jgi:hypothetical protein
VVVALRADLKIPLNDLPIDKLIARVAFRPQLLRGLQLLSSLSLLPLLFTFFEPSHLLWSSFLYK